MAAFTSNAAFSATTESIRLYWQAVRLAPSPPPICRVCTSAECRYRLCGITVAPRIADGHVQALRRQARDQSGHHLRNSRLGQKISIRKQTADDRRSAQG